MVRHYSVYRKPPSSPTILNPTSIIISNFKSRDSKKLEPTFRSRKPKESMDEIFYTTEDSDDDQYHEHQTYDSHPGESTEGKASKWTWRCSPRLLPNLYGRLQAFWHLLIPGLESLRWAKFWNCVDMGKVVLAVRCVEGKSARTAVPSSDCANSAYTRQQSSSRQVVMEASTGTPADQEG